MDYNSFIDREEVKIGGVAFAISRIPAFQAQKVYGEIVKTANTEGDIGMTYLPESVSRELLSYTAFCDEGTWFVLDQDQRFDRAFKDVKNLLKLEVAMIRKNFGFLFDGGLRELLADLRGAAEEAI